MTSSNGSYLLLTNKIPRSMKLTALSLMLSLSAFAANADAQQVSVTVSNAKVKTVLNSISDQTGLSLAYSAQVVDLNRKVSLNFVNTEVSEVLNAMFGNTAIGYEIKDGKIYLFKAAERTTALANQQKKIITGTVVDPNGEAVIGANVLVKGTTNGTITDMGGKFSLEVPEGAMLQITYVGYANQEIKVGNQSSLSIIMKDDSEALDELVVVGYGVARKKDLTGAVGAIKGDNLAARKTTQLSTALQGAVSGVTVTRDNNAPGATAGSIKVRGVTTIGDTSPLVIIDGVPGDINQVNPDDVENMSVLKDAASASIYGSRAAAGVILITTKRAKENDLSLGYNFEYGWEIPTKQPEYAGLQRYMEITNELRYNDNPAGGWYQTYSEDQINNWLKNSATDPNNYPNTDWQDLILKSSAPRQKHAINIAGGSKAVRTKASFTYDKIDGLYADRYYERFMLRVNNDFKINKYLGATLDFNFKRSKSHRPTFDPFDRMRITPPVYAAMWDDGRIAEGKSGANPYGRMIAGGEKNEWYNQIGGKASLDLTPIDGLKISGVIAPVYNFDKSKTFNKAVPYTIASDPNTIGGYLEGQTSTKLTENRNDSYNVTIQGIANYIKSFGKHNLNVMAGYETYYAFWENLMASRDQYELDSYPYLDLGPLSMRDNSGNAQEVAYQSWFGRVMYNYDNRYLLQGNIRYDGSSRFHKDYRWGSFPSFSAGWVISEENFLKEKENDWLSYLKLRASWGTLGNERIFKPNTTEQNYYPYQAAIVFSNVLFYQNGQRLSQLSAAQQVYAIENISWEKTQSFDIGLDAQFLDSRLRFAFDYYKKTTKDMLLALEIPDYVGFDNPQKNTGDMYTNGFELDLGWSDQVNDWSYSVAVNFSDFVSKMGDLGGTQFLGDQVKMEGSEFNEWYGYVSDGLILTEEDLAGPQINNNAQIGDIKYVDISGPDGKPDGKITPDYDRVLLGGSLPRFTYGGNVSVGYKGFDLSMAFQGVGRQNVRYSTVMVQPLRENYGNVPNIIDGNYWSSKNTEAQNAEAFYPRLTYANASSNYAMSDYWLFNGRYFRLKNLTFGYTLPKSLTEKASIKHARIYVSGNDLFCISKFPKGWDPEMGSSAYPITTSLLFGVSVNF